MGSYVEPYSNSAKDKAAAKRVLDFELGWLVTYISAMILSSLAY